MSRPLEVHLWSSGLGQPGGIQAYAREARAALQSGDSILLRWHVSLHDHPTGAWADAACGRWPKSLRPWVLVLRAWQRAWLQRPQMILATHPHFLRAMIPLRRLGVRVVVAAHGVESWWRDGRPSGLPFDQADGILAVSQHTAQQVRNHAGVSAQRVKVVANTYDEHRFFPAAPSEKLRHELGLRSDERVILTVGRMLGSEGYKGQEVVMQAVRMLGQRHGPLRHVILGEGDDVPRLKRLAADLGLGQQVLFVGRVADAQMADYYRLAQVFAMPSTGEGFGIAFLEAQACGVPCVAGNQDGSADALDSGRLGLLVNPREPGEVAAALDCLLGGRDPRPWLHSPTLLGDEVKRIFGRAVYARHLNAALHSLMSLPN